MHFFDHTAQRRIYMLHIFRLHRVHQLVRVMVHLSAALRTNYLYFFCRPHVLPLIQSNIVAAIAERLCHPDKFVQEFISAPDKRLVEEIPGLVKYLADIAEVDIPEDVD